METYSGKITLPQIPLLAQILLPLVLDEAQI